MRIKTAPVGTLAFAALTLSGCDPETKSFSTLTLEIPAEENERALLSRVKAKNALIFRLSGQPTWACRGKGRCVRCADHSKSEGCDRTLPPRYVFIGLEDVELSSKKSDGSVPGVRIKNTKGVETPSKGNGSANDSESRVMVAQDGRHLDKPEFINEAVAKWRFEENELLVAYQAPLDMAYAYADRGRQVMICKGTEEVRCPPIAPDPDPFPPAFLFAVLSKSLPSNPPPPDLEKVPTSTVGRP